MALSLLQSSSFGPSASGADPSTAPRQARLAQDDRVGEIVRGPSTATRQDCLAQDDGFLLIRFRDPSHGVRWLPLSGSFDKRRSINFDWTGELGGAK